VVSVRRAALLFSLSLLAAAPAHAEPVILDRLVATVNAHKILRSDVARRAAQYQTSLHDTLDRMIDEILILEDAEAAHLSISDEQVEQAIEEIGKPYDLDKAGVIAAAEKKGLPPDVYRAELRRQLLVYKWESVRVAPKVSAPSTGTKEEREEARRALLAAERKHQVALLRTQAFIELRW
jgi:parvulin-like peptidyl-prolyl isomerase